MVNRLTYFNSKLAAQPREPCPLPPALRDFYATLWLNVGDLARESARAQKYLKTAGGFQGIENEQPRRQPQT